MAGRRQGYGIGYGLGLGLGLGMGRGIAGVVVRVKNRNALDVGGGFGVRGDGLRGRVMGRGGLLHRVGRCSGRWSQG